MDFVAADDHDAYYIQVSCTIADEGVRERKLSSFKGIDDGYRKVVITMDDAPFTLLENGYRKLGALDFLLRPDLLRTL